MEPTYTTLFMFFCERSAHVGFIRILSNRDAVNVN